VVVETVIPHDLVGKMEQIRMAFNDYLQIKLRQRPIRIVYFLMLTIATLMIIFLALWVSLRIAKGITVPIKHLASATERVASGDLDFRIDFRRDDEIGMLINSFNSMLEEIKSKRESLEKAYGEAERRRLSMEVILENIRSGVIFFNASHNVETVNNAALELLSIDRKSLLGLNFIKLLKRLKSERLFDMAKRLIENRTGSIKEDIRTYIDGRPMDFRVYITVMNDSHGKFMGTLVVFDNLTDVVMEQRVRAWQEVARRIAHEIKNPLTPIILSAERLKRKWEERSTDFADVLNKSTKIIITEGNRLKSLINEFSKFGKMPKINPQPTDIASMIEDVVELYSNSKNAEIITQIDGDLPQVEIDRQQMKMVLINMIDNAVQADADKIWISARYNDKTDSISLEIADNGRGISVEDKNKIFEPYFSTRKDGTGLGLAIANNIILSHRGYIIVKDNIPKGSQFIINLPVNHG
jgi:two-component system nitrogen regulation sensor histidine kinase NtrY